MVCKEIVNLILNKIEIQFFSYTKKKLVQIKCIIYNNVYVSYILVEEAKTEI